MSLLLVTLCYTCLTTVCEVEKSPLGVRFRGYGGSGQRKEADVQARIVARVLAEAVEKSTATADQSI